MSSNWLIKTFHMYIDKNLHFSESILIFLFMKKFKDFSKKAIIILGKNPYKLLSISNKSLSDFINNLQNKLRFLFSEYSFFFVLVNL